MMMSKIYYSYRLYGEFFLLLMYISIVPKGSYRTYVTDFSYKLVDMQGIHCSLVVPFYYLDLFEDSFNLLY